MEAPHAAGFNSRSTLRAVGDKAGRVGAQRLAALPSRPPPHAELAGRARGVTGTDRTRQAPPDAATGRASPAGARRPKFLTTRGAFRTGFGRRAASGARHSRGGKDDQPPTGRPSATWQSAPIASARNDPSFSPQKPPPRAQWLFLFLLWTMTHRCILTFRGRIVVGKLWKIG